MRLPLSLFLFVVVQLLSHVPLFATLWTAARQASMSITNSRSMFKLISIESVMPSNHLILCCPLLLLPSILPTIRVFSNESVLHTRWSKYWSFSISPSNEYSRLIPFRIDWFDLFADQGTLKCLVQQHNSKASILLRSAFFMVQLSQPCMITGKIVTLTIQTFVGKVISWLFNMQIFIAFLPRTKHIMKNLVLLLFNVQTRLLTPLFSQRGYSQNVVRKLGYIAKAQVSL